MKRMIILNSYNLTGRNPYDYTRIKYFFKGLQEEGYEEGKNLHAEVIDSNDLLELESALEQEGKDGIDLIHAVGTPNAAIAARYTKEIPIVYYGAHPEGTGKEDCSNKNMCGLILTLPLLQIINISDLSRNFFPLRKIFTFPSMKKQFSVQKL